MSPMQSPIAPIRILTALVLAALTGLTLVAVAQTPVAATLSQESVFRFVDASAVDGSASHLIRTDDAIAMEVSTDGLVANAPYTAWWVIFNTPAGCSDDCGEDDIFAEDGSMDLNPDATISILFADGAVTDANGAARFSALLEEGRPLGEVLAGPGLTDAQGAEVHLVVRAHGALDADRLWEQLTTFEMECPACEDVQFVVYKPAGLSAGN